MSEWDNPYLRLLVAVCLILTISLIPVLIAFLRRFQEGRPHLFPAVSVWVGFGLAPAIFLTGFLFASGSSYPPSYLTDAVALVLIHVCGFLAVLGILSLTHRKERLPVLLIWLVLGMLPVTVPVVFIPWWIFPSVWALMIVVSPLPLVAGLIGLGTVRPRNPTDTKSMKKRKVVGGAILFAIGLVVVAIGLVPEMMCSVISAAGGQCRTLSYTTVSSFILGLGGLLAFGGVAVSISGVVRKRERAGPRGPA